MASFDVGLDSMHDSHAEPVRSRGDVVYIRHICLELDGMWYIYVT